MIWNTGVCFLVTKQKKNEKNKERKVCKFFFIPLLVYSLMFKNYQNWEGNLDYV